MDDVIGSANFLVNRQLRCDSCASFLLGDPIAGMIRMNCVDGTQAVTTTVVEITLAAGLVQERDVGDGEVGGWSIERREPRIDGVSRRWDG